MLIDVYSHYSPPVLLRFLEDHSGGPHPFRNLFGRIPLLSDLDARLDFLDTHGVERSCLVPLPWLESCPSVLEDLETTQQAMRLANEAMAEVEARSAGRLLGVALLAAHNPEVLEEEYEYAIHSLHLHGAVLFCGPQTTPADDPRLEGFYRRAALARKPIWLHPCRAPSFSDYQAYTDSRHQIWSSLGWVYDTTVAMIHLAMGGLFRRHPELVVIAHHHGGMLPFFYDRFATQLKNFDEQGPTDLLEDTRRFYCDTATFGVNPAALRAALDFFGEERVLFGTDSPMDASSPGFFVRSSLRSIEELSLPSGQQEKLLWQNAERILRGR